MTDEMSASLHGVHKHEVTVELAGGKSIHFETGKLAKQAHGSCIVRIGDNVVLATACANADPREGIDFFPLTVDYREYTYAAGRIPGGFIKREGRPSEREILTSRQIDRPIRPLFPEGFRCETQVIAMVLSADTTNDPDVAGINGASVALSVSDIPFHGPIGAVRVGQVDGNFVINPDLRRTARRQAEPDGCRHRRRHRHDRVGCEGSFGRDGGPGHRVRPPGNQEDLRRHQRSGARRLASAKRVVEPVVTDEAYLGDLRSKFGERLLDAVNTEKHPKNESYALIKQLKDEIKSGGSGRRRSRPQEGQQVLRSAARADFPRASNQREAPSRWPQVRSDPRYLDRSWRAAADSRLCDLHSRRNPGAGHHHLGHRRRHAAAGGLRRRSQEALHAALQFPAVLGGRSCVPARSGPSRDWSRSIGRARDLRSACPAIRIGLTPCASCPTFWSRMDRRRWRRFAEPHSA